MKFSPIDFLPSSGPLGRFFQRYADAHHHVQVEMLRAVDDYRDEVPLSELYRIDPDSAPDSLGYLALYAGFVRPEAPSEYGPH